MKYISAYMLVKLSGNENPTVEDMKGIIESVGIDFDNKKAEEIFGKLKGKDFNEVIYDGKSKLSAVSNPQTAQQTTNEQNEQKEEDHKEEEESFELDVGFDDLFG